MMAEMKGLNGSATQNHFCPLNILICHQDQFKCKIPDSLWEKLEPRKLWQLKLKCKKAFASGNANIST